MKISYEVDWEEDTSYSEKDLPYVVIKRTFGTIDENHGIDEEIIAAFNSEELSVEFAVFLNSKKDKETNSLDCWIDDEEAEVEVIFDKDEGYIMFILDDYNKTKIKFDWDIIRQLGLKMDEEK